MKKFSVILIIVGILLAGYVLFPVIVFLFKAILGIVAITLIGGAIYLGYRIGSNLSKGKI